METELPKKIVFKAYRSVLIGPSTEICLPNCFTSEEQALHYAQTHPLTKETDLRPEAILTTFLLFNLQLLEELFSESGLAIFKIIFYSNNEFLNLPITTLNELETLYLQLLELENPQTPHEIHL